MNRLLLFFSSIFLICIVFTSCDRKYKDYEAVYKDSGYILLQKKDYKHPATTKINFVDSAGSTVEVKLFIDSATAIRMIGYNDEKFGTSADAPKYIDFNPSEIFTMLRNLNDVHNKLRIYYSCYDTITAQLRYKTAWRQFVNKQTLVLVPTVDGTDMFRTDPINVGTPCPPVCPDYFNNTPDTNSGTRYLKIGQIKPRHRVNP